MSRCHPTMRVTCQWVAAVCLTAVLGSAVLADVSTQPVLTPVNIFGDGNPYNGVEDDRRPLLGGQGEGVGLASQQMNSGTVFCDGKVRGTAVVVDVRTFAPGLEGAILASAAHVIFDLDRKRLFKRCEFHFMALGAIARYRSRIDLDRVRLGGFDPHKSTTDPAFGKGDWAFLYVPRPRRGFNVNQALSLSEFSFDALESFQQAGGEFRLVAFDSSSGVMSVSANCTVTQSDPEDLGGGLWKGQMLDDCDSGDGASGGGIVAVLADQQYLIGIRTGSHWDRQVFPVGRFPDGPPDGAVWDLRSNTNFGRAIDRDMISALKDFCKRLMDDKV